MSKRASPMRRALYWAAAAVTAVAVTGCGGTASSTSHSAARAPAQRVVILATTTSTQDSGLLDVVVPAFEKASGYRVKTVAVGTGQALKMGRQGNADVLLVHAPASEETFMEDGYGVDRRIVAHNYFYVVGPASDPAGIKSAGTAAAAFRKIAASRSTFVSRGDGSGTETKELAIWSKAGTSPKGRSWYLQSGQGMGATLQIASEKGGYTLTDNATFLTSASKLELTSLVEKDPFLLNPYHVISVNSAKWPKVNKAGAKAFADYITQSKGQSLIAGFGGDEYDQPLFVADAGKSETELK
ncbi:substrate-binding domain-containing protein [Streptomyces cavernae]|uniref:substrate-binding domain-containing protein n=1 Tax=Streptomyces cavernae TaxID=2259034 RepID=UPI000FEBE783|nr:substrate-binding domain-containing protein [Streptomyces cavernae]